MEAWRRRISMRKINKEKGVRKIGRLFLTVQFACGLWNALFSILYMTGQMPEYANSARLHLAPL